MMFQSGIMLGGAAHGLPIDGRHYSVQIPVQDRPRDYLDEDPIAPLRHETYHLFKTGSPAQACCWVEDSRFERFRDHTVAMLKREAVVRRFSTVIDRMNNETFGHLVAFREVFDTKLRKPMWESYRSLYGLILRFDDASRVWIYSEKEDRKIHVADLKDAVEGRTELAVMLATTDCCDFNSMMADLERISRGW